MTLREFDASLCANRLCGVDEAGRGPLAGDVYAAAVILPKEYDLEGLNDSKKLTPKKREKLFDEIQAQAVSFCIAKATVAEIEELNILNAAMLAMGIIREFFGTGAVFGVPIFQGVIDPIIWWPATGTPTWACPPG